MLLILGFLCGTVLAFRFAVQILVPAILLGWLLALVGGLLAASSAGTIILAMVMVAVVLQLGYLSGILLRWGFAATRMRRRGEWHVKPEAAPDRAY